MTIGVYPPMFHYLRKYGMYVMRFFKDYSWRYVIIDDRLPCYNRGYGEPELVFGKCRSQNEFWVPLIEKAYAKIHNCYESLISGFIDDGLTDMTGLAQEKIIFKKRGTKKIKYSGEKGDKAAVQLWKDLKRWCDEDSMMGCSALGGSEHEITMDEVPVGILSGHAYSIVNVISIPKSEEELETLKETYESEDIEVPEEFTEWDKNWHLLRIRNPWGKILCCLFSNFKLGQKEWNGNWSDGSDEIIDHLNDLN